MLYREDHHHFEVVWNVFSEPGFDFFKYDEFLKFEVELQVILTVLFVKQWNGDIACTQWKGAGTTASPH